MPLKILLSYRRQDSGANAIGISQYLENEFSLVLKGILADQ
jgi:hypothetical protein